MNVGGNSSIHGFTFDSETKIARRTVDHDGHTYTISVKFSEGATHDAISMKLQKYEQVSDKVAAYALVAGLGSKTKDGGQYLSSINFKADSKGKLTPKKQYTPLTSTVSGQEKESKTDKKERQKMVHHTNEWLTACKLYNRSLKYSISLNPYAWRFIVLILLLIPSVFPFVTCDDWPPWRSALDNHSMDIVVLEARRESERQSYR